MRAHSLAHIPDTNNINRYQSRIQIKRKLFCCFEVLWISTTDLRIRILLFSSVAENKRCHQKISVFFAYYILKVHVLHVHQFSQIKRQKEATKQQKSSFFFFFDGRIRICIREAQNHPDPQHCCFVYFNLPEGQYCVRGLGFLVNSRRCNAQNNIK